MGTFERKVRESPTYNLLINDLIKLNKVNGSNVNELRELHDRIKSNVGALKTVRIQQEYFDITNIHNNQVPRLKWLLRGIYAVITGKDGEIKWVKFFLGKTENKLYPVECFNEFTYANYYATR